jgi:hypothetical protein
MWSLFFFGSQFDVELLLLGHSLMMWSLFFGAQFDVEFVFSVPCLMWSLFFWCPV